MGVGLYEYHRGLPDKSYYEYIADTPGVKTAAFWKDWCQAIFYAGTTLHLWNEVPEVKAAFLSVCSLEPGQDVLVIGKYVEESGLGAAVRSLVPDGRVIVEEIGARVIDAFRAGDPASGTELEWDFGYLDAFPDASLDRIVLHGAASHVADWERFGGQVARVLTDGGRLIVHGDVRG